MTSVTYRDDAVEGGPCIGLHLNNRSLLSLLLAKFVSSTSPQKPPATYTRVNDFGPHTDSIFRGRLIRESDLYASIYGNLYAIVGRATIWDKTLLIGKLPFFNKLTDGGSFPGVSASRSC